ncbi:MAG: signal peptidase II [Oligosphaeraceae bacterium]|jgi:signal peptidase II|nr:signal peptidase II [Oligosphaeraceae bacterium]
MKPELPEDSGSMAAAKAPGDFLLSFWGLPGIIALTVFVFDYLSKVWVLRHWPQPNIIYREVIPGFFSLVHFQNTGAAWGMFAQHTWVLGIISCLALLAVVLFFNFLTERRPTLAILYGILAGGIAGNLYDRLFRGFVVDFLFFYYRDYQHSWPAFNIADSAITCAVTAMIVYSLFFAKSPQTPNTTGTDRTAAEK